MPETLESIAARIESLAGTVEALRKSTDERFDQMGAHLAMKIEALDTKIVLVYDEVVAMRKEARRNATEHSTFTKRLDNHDIRILALETPRRPKR